MNTTAIEQASEVIAQIDVSMSTDGLGDSLPSECDRIARALADARLLLTDADRTVLDAARGEIARHQRHPVISGVSHTCVCDLCNAVRARRV